MNNELSPGSGQSNWAKRVGKIFLGLILTLLSVLLIGSFFIPVLMGFVFAGVLYGVMTWKRLEWIGQRTRAVLITVGFALVVLLPIGGVLYSGTLTIIEQVQSPSTAKPKPSEEASAASAEKPAADPGGEKPEDAGPAKAATNNEAAKKAGKTPEKAAQSPSPLMASAKHLIGDKPQQAVQQVVRDNSGLSKWLDRLPVSKTKVMEWATTALTQARAVFGRFAGKILAGIPGMVGELFLVLFTIYFALSQGEQWRSAVRRNRLLPSDLSRDLLETFDSACFSCVYGTAVSGLVQATIYTALCLITGIGDPLMIGTVTFFASFLPLLGTMPVFFGMMLFALTGDNSWAPFLVLGFGILGGISDNFVYPWVVGSRAEVHPLITLLAIFGAVEWIGIYGLFLGPVTVILFLQLIKWLEKTDWGSREALSAPAPLERSQ